MTAPVIYWIRRDFRLADNPALVAACAQGAPVIPVFIHDDCLTALGAAPKWRLGLGVAAFAAGLRAVGSDLVLRRGDALSALMALVAETGAQQVHWNRLYDPESRARDEGVKAALRAAGITATSHAGHLIHEPWQAQTGTGGFYKVYTPFWKTLRDRDVAPCLAVPKIPAPATFPAGDNLAAWNLGRAMDRGAAVVAPHCQIGEAAATARLARFLDGPIASHDAARARLVLEGVDRIACEDTRHSGQLLARLGIRRPLLSFHQHNQATRLPELLEALQRGERLAVISDAGLPGISDPGEPLVAAARQAGLEVVCIPGPCAVTTALVSSGLPSGRFCFEGFLAAKPSQRRRQLQELAAEPRTLVLFEAPHRLIALLEDLLELLGDRPLRVARELTKRHEQQVGPTVAAALEHFRRVPPLGECTLVLGGAPAAAPPAWNAAALRAELELLLADGLSKLEAARTLAARTGHSRRDLYALLHRDDGTDKPGDPEGSPRT